jgi:hypothetical protein
MAHLHASGSYDHVKGAGATFDITITATAAGETVALYIAGGAVPSNIHLTNASGATFTRRSPSYSSGAQDNSIWDATATGGETVIHVVLSGDDNVSGEWYELGTTLTFVAGSHNGSGATADAASDNQIRPDASTITGAGLLIAGFSASSDTAYGTGNRWRQLGPAGHIYGEGGNQPSNGGVNLVWMSGLADIDADHAWPQQGDAGDYAATSVWLGASTCFAAQALYADSSGASTVPAVSDTVRENSLPGTLHSHWFVSTGTNATIAGYTDKPSYQAGDTVEFMVDSTGHDFQVEIYRIGDYAFDTFGARNQLGCQGGYLTGSVVTQPAPLVDSTLGCTSCEWTSAASWTIPDDAVSGQYYGLLRRTDDTSQVSSFDFIVSADPAGRIAVCLPDMTRRAYNPWGATTDHGPRGVGGTWTGRSLYQAGSDAALPDITHRAYAVSTQCPSGIQESQASTYFADAEQGTIQFMEAQGYDLCYLSNWDLDADPTILTRSTLVVMLGHHEYWTMAVYDSFTAARDAGVSMMIQSSNTALWRVRFDPADTDRETMICYKDSTTADAGHNASLPGTGYDPGGYTGTWRDTRQIGGGVNNPNIRSEDALTGQLFIASGPVQTTLTVPAASKTLPIWRNSADIQALTSGTHYTTVVNALGYEADYPSGGPNQPANLVNLNPYAASFVTGSNAAGSLYDGHIGPITLGFTLYRADSGALIFNAGTWRGWWGASRWQGDSFGATIDLNWANALLALLFDLGAVPHAVREMEPGIDTPLTNPATGAPTGGRSGVARAYGLKVPATAGFLAFFT